MKRFSEQFKKQASNIRLSAAEKDVLRDRLTAYMAYHPITTPAPKTATSSRRAMFTEPFIEWAMPTRLYRQLVLGCFALVFVGVPALAERAVPGDVLYPMKVRVNEEVRASLTSGGYEKVAWETKRLERRISEARLLAKEGKLTPEIEAGVIAAVNEHQVAAAGQIATLRSIDADAAALAELTLVSVLDVQSAALRAGDTASTTKGMSTVAIAMALDEAQAHVEQVSSDGVSYERLVAKLEQETTRGRELLLSIKDNVNEQEYADLERRIGDVERKIVQGTIMYTEDAVRGQEFLTQTWRDMQVVITFMTDIDVRSSLAIESFVPIVLTPEEERALAINAYNEAETALTKIEETLPAVTDVGISDKVTLTIPQIKTLLLTASTSLDTDVEVAKASAFEARDYTRSIMSLASFTNLNPDTAMMTLDVDASSTATTTDGLINSATGTRDVIIDTPLSE
ncbi:MAG: DUF5667 domain-containing protein [Candidatus Paceibacteria bacterium]